MDDRENTQGELEWESAFCLQGISNVCGMGKSSHPPPLGGRDLPEMPEKEERVMPTENEEWIEASRLYAAENERRFVRIQDAADISESKIIDLETTIGGLNLELIAAREHIGNPDYIKGLVLVDAAELDNLRAKNKGRLEQWFKDIDENKRLREAFEVLKHRSVNLMNQDVISVDDCWCGGMDGHSPECLFVKDALEVKL